MLSLLGIYYCIYRLAEISKANKFNQEHMYGMYISQYTLVQQIKDSCTQAKDTCTQAKDTCTQAKDACTEFRMHGTCGIYILVAYTLYEES